MEIPKLKHVDNFLFALCNNSTHHFFEPKNDNDKWVTIASIDVLNNYYSPFDYEPYLRELFDKFNKEINNFLVTLNSDIGRFQYLKFLLDEFKKGEDEFELTAGYYKLQKYDTNVNRFKNYFETFTIHSFEKQTYNINKTAIKEILADYPTFEDYHKHRMQMLYNCQREYIDKTLLVINTLLIDQNSVSKSVELNSTLSGKENDNAYEKSSRISYYYPRAIGNSFKFRIQDGLGENEILDIENERRENIEELFDFLVNNSCVDLKTKLPDFRAVFKGGIIKSDKKVKWVSAIIELKILVNLLLPYMEIGSKGKWIIASKCFARGDGNPFKKEDISKTDKNEIQPERKKLLEGFIRNNIERSGNFLKIIPKK